MNKEQIKHTAITMARETGLINLSRRELCKRIGIPEGSFAHYAGCSFGELFEEVRGVVGDSGDHHAVTRSRTNKDLRKRAILRSAIEVAKVRGITNLTREAVAAEAGISTGLITRYFSTMKQLRRAIMRAAVTGEHLEVIAQGLAVKDDQALKAPDELKRRAADLMVNG